MKKGGLVEAMNNGAKILGMILCLAILIGLLVPAMPVSAADSDEGFSMLPGPLPPPGGSTTFVVPNSSISLFAQAADGLTIFAWDAGNRKFYKSTDGGANFARTPAGNTLNGLTITAMAVSSNYANDSTIVAAVGTSIYRSTNGGATFGIVPGVTLAGATVVNSLAYGLAINGADNTMLISTDAGLFIWSTATYTSPLSGAITGNVLAVAFSPNFSRDYVIFAANTTTVAQIDVSGIGAPITQAISGSPAHAVIVPPSDFNPTANDVILVALSPGGLQRVDFSAPSNTVLFSQAVSSVEVNPAGVAYIGMATGDVRYFPGAFTSTEPTVTQATKKPFPNNVVGTNALVLINHAGNIIAAEGGTNGGIYISQDAGVTYNGTGLISFSSLTYQSLNIIDSNTWYLMARDGNHYLLMNTSNVGISWQVIFNYDASTTDILGVFPSPLYSTDKTLYVVQKNNRVWRTVNEGITFTVATAPGPVSPTTSAFTAKDGSTYYIAYATNNAVYKSGRSSPSAPYTGAGNITSLLAAPNGDIIAGTDAGNIFKSIDDAATFTNVVTTPGNTAGLSNVGVALAPDYASSNILYAVSDTAGASTQGIYMLDTAGSKWVHMNGNDVANQVIAASNNSVYYNRSTLNGFARSLDPSVSPFSPSTWGYANASPGNTVLTSLNLIGNRLYAIAGGNNLITFNDVAAGPVTTTAPTANATNIPENNITFSWNAFSAIPYPVKYDVQVSRDNQFISNVIDTTTDLYSGPVSGTLLVYSASGNSSFLPGTSYHYRVRVASTNPGSPLVSGWSTTVPFTIEILPVTVTTNAATGVGYNTATLNGILNTLEPNSSIGLSFEYWKGTDTPTAVGATPPIATTNNTSFKADLSGLISGTTYTFHVVAAGGQGSPIKGNDMSFTTSTQNSGGTGGVGGGGGGVPAYNTVGLSGMTTGGTFKVNSSGLIQSPVQLKTEDGKVMLSIASGTTLKKDKYDPVTVLTANVLTSALEIPTNNAIILAYKFGPDGATFDPALTLTMTYDPDTQSKNIDEKDLYIAYWNGTMWQSLGGIVDTSARTVTVKVAHFSNYALMGQISLPTPATKPSPAPMPTPSVTQTESPTISATATPAISPTTVISPMSGIILTPIPNQSTSPVVPQSGSPRPAIGFTLIVWVAVALVAIVIVTVLIIARKRTTRAK